MDLRRDFLFPVIIWVVIQRDFILGGQAGINDGSLILESGDELEIDTTVPSIVKKNRNSTNCNFTASLQMRNSSRVAFVTFSDDIELKKGSRINVTGQYALSIKSQNGNIIIKTDINMTCNKEIVKTTCLGGFTQSHAALRHIYRGLGPGGLKNVTGDELTKQYLASLCLPGSSHGGVSNKPKDTFKVGGSYDKENLKTFRGGSGGSCVGNPRGVAGGGAIELVSGTGSIIIDASIRASAQSTSSGTRCSGGSGGLIRLNARKVQQVYELIPCVRRANENAGNLISVVQFLIESFSTNKESDHEYEIGKQIARSI